MFAFKICDVQCSITNVKPHQRKYSENKKRRILSRVELCNTCDQHKEVFDFNNGLPLQNIVNYFE